MTQYILASASPRRKQLLEQIGLTFTILPSNAEEIITKTKPSEVVIELSNLKCFDIANQITQNTLTNSNLGNDTIVIGADTIVSYSDQILGKPADAQDAFEMLKNLSNHCHSVFTGVTLAHIKDQAIVQHISFYEETKVYMKEFSDSLIHSYIASGECLDKAGAYGIQGLGCILVDHIEGDYNNVVGLPVSRLYDILQTFQVSHEPAK